MPTASDLYYFSFNETERTRPPVILIHGAAGNHLSWPPEVRRLPEERIYALDLPGHGKSEGIGLQLIEDYSRVVRKFFEDVGLSKAIVVGHSMGAAIALDFAIRFPKRVLGLGLIGGGARLRVSEELLDTVSNVSTYLTGVQWIIERSFALSADPNVKKLVGQRMADTRSAVVYGDFLACNSFDLTDKIKRIKVPTLVLCGSLDKMTPLRYSEYLSSQIEGAKMQIVFDAGHMVMLEKPEIVASALQDFIKRVPYSPGE